ncbi:MAG: oxygenase MpaB family protein [Flavobacteriales bacterium]
MENKWSTAFLQEQSHKTDPVADTLIAEITAAHGLEEVRKLFSQLTENNDLLKNDQVLQKVKDYFKKDMDLPAWADQKKIRIGQDLFALYGPEIAFLLNFRSLPLCYTSKNGAKVLYATGRLKEDGHNVAKITRRLMETSQMVINVMSPGGFAPTGKGIVTVKKVRLIHAAIRYYLKNPNIPTGDWDVNELGEPINQEEMAGTLMAFGPLVMNGLERLGIHTTNEEKDAYLHCWKLVGHFIGLDEHLFPENHEEGWQLGVAIIKRNYSESEEARVLAKSIIGFGQRIIPYRFLDDMPEYFIQRFTKDVSDVAGVDFARLLDIKARPTFKKKAVTWVMEKSFYNVSYYQKRSGLFARASKWLNGKMLQGTITFYMKNNNVEFHIPPSLKDNWKLN